jgi:LysR family nitrogen assimilation transcriptional regulator
LGECVLPHAKAMLTDFERLRRDSESMAGVPTGTVRIGMMPALAPLIVADLFARVAERFPRVLLSVAEGYSGQLNEMLADGTLDIAILFDYGRASRIGREFLAPVDSWLVGGPGVLTPADAPMSFAAMARQPLAMPPMSNSLRIAMSRHAERCGIELNVVVEISSFIALTEMLAQGRCVSVLPYFAVARKLATGELTGLPISEPAIDRSLMLATSSFMPASLAAREVSRILRSLVMEAEEKQLLTSGPVLS